MRGGRLADEVAVGPGLRALKVDGRFGLGAGSGVGDM